MKQPIDERTQVLIGMWMAGNELQHLQHLQPEDITSNVDGQAIISAIKTKYYNGIVKGNTVGNREKRNLLDDLVHKGYDEIEVCAYADKAKEAHTAYMQIVASIYADKSRAMLKTVDLEKDGAQEQMQKILDTYRMDGVQSLVAPSQDVIRQIVHNVKERKAGKKVKVIPLGLSDLTKLTGGLREGELTAVSGRPAGGKTAFSIHMARKIASEGFRVMYDELEMSDTPIGKRMIAAETSDKITKGMIDAIDPMTEEQYKEFIYGATKVHNMLNSGNFILLRGQNELESIEQQLELYKPDVLIIDQLTQLRDSRHTFVDKRTRYNHLTGALKTLALKTGVSIVIVCQLNRQSENYDYPNNSMFKDSGSIEEDADRCIVLWPVKPDEDWDAPGDPVDIWVTKNREGEANFSVHTAFWKSRQRFLPLDTVV